MSIFSEQKMFQSESFSTDYKLEHTKQAAISSVSSQTTVLEKNDAQVQTPVVLEVAVQTDETNKIFAPKDIRLQDGLLSFLKGVEPAISRILTNNASSEAFRGWNTWKQIQSSVGNLDDQLVPKFLGSLGCSISRSISEQKLKCFLWHKCGNRIILSIGNEEASEGYLIMKQIDIMSSLVESDIFNYAVEVYPH